MKKQTAPYSIKEAALIFESGADFELDYVVGVTAPEKTRISRTMARDSISEEEVRRRMERQIPEDEKMRLCDYVITNDEQELVIPQVVKIHEALIAMKP
jgi:dephospho-CoA kinase